MGRAGSHFCQGTYGILRAIYTFAVVSDRLPRSPCRQINLPKITKTRRTYVSEVGVVAMANAMDPRYRAVV